MSGKKGSKWGNSIGRFLEIIISLKPNQKGCLIWPFGKDKDGYGYYFIEGKTWSTHRLIFDLKKSTTCQGFVVMHSCDEPSCCNIEHLSLGNPSENTKDMVRKDRHVKGSLVGTSKLTELQVNEIRSKYPGKSYKVLGKEYGVCKQTICNAVNEATYRNASHVNERYQPVNNPIRIKL